MIRSLPDRLRNMANKPTVPSCTGGTMRTAADVIEANDRYISDLEAEIRVLRAVDKNTDYAAKWREAQAIVDKLPKTKDGVPILPGMELWADFRDGVFHGIAWAQLNNSGKRVPVTFDEPGVELYAGCKVRDTDPLACCLYSTEAAALAAQEAKQP